LIRSRTEVDWEADGPLQGPTRTVLLDDLRGAVGADRVVTDEAVMRSYAHDDAEWAPYGIPAAVVRPRTTGDVQAVVQA
jgi:glycolate oxidase